jgi:hypothetical protein
MAILTAEPRWPSLDVPRAHPCEAAGTGPGARACGATPAGLWRRSCGNRHSRSVRLCGSHAALSTIGLVACAECAARGVAAAARLEPLDLIWQ